MKYLIKSVETWRVPNENEAKQLIEEAKNDRNFTLAKYSSEYKCTKSKGEIVDDWYRVVLTKEFTSEKEPEYTATVSYNVERGFFPEAVTSTGEEDDEDEDDGDGGIEF